MAKKYFPPLMRLVRGVSAYNMAMLSWWVSTQVLTALKGTILLTNDIPIVENIARMYFSYLYVPMILTTMGFFLNCALSCAYRILIPLSHQAYVLTICLPAYTFAMCAIMVAGYKVLTVQADTMADCYHSSGRNQYQSLKLKFRLAVTNHPVWFGVVWAGLVGVVVWIAVASSDIQQHFVDLPSIRTALSIVGAQAVVVITSMIYWGNERHWDSGFFFATFWPWIVPKVRDFSLVLVLIHAVQWVINHDIAYASSRAIEVSVLLLLPHVWLNFVSSLALGIGAFTESLVWLYNAPQRCQINVFALSVLYLSWGAWTVYFIMTLDVVLLTVFACSVQVLRAVDLVRTEDEEEGAVADLVKDWTIWDTLERLAKQFIALLFFHSSLGLLEPESLGRAASPDASPNVSPRHGPSAPPKAFGSFARKASLRGSSASPSAAAFHAAIASRTQIKWRVRARVFIRVLGTFGLLVTFGFTALALAEQMVIGGRVPSARIEVNHSENASSLEFFNVVLGLTARDTRPLSERAAVYGFDVDALPSKQQDACAGDAGADVDGTCAAAPPKDEVAHRQFLIDQGISTEDSYPRACRKTWGGLDAFTYALFSGMSYLGPHDFATSLKFINAVTKPADGSPPMDWELRDNVTSLGINSANYYDLYSRTHNLTVLVIRGTNPISPLDLLQNIAMYVEVGMYQLCTFVVPLLSLAPHSLVADAVLASGVAEYIEFFNVPRRDRLRYYWEHVILHAEKRRAEGSEVVLTGHSLGGAIGNIVGARLGMHAVAFNAPGILLSRKKFGIDTETAVHQYTSNIINDYDLVPMVDRQGGEVTHLPCPAQRHDACHLVEMTVAELWRACPTARARTLLSSVELSSPIDDAMEAINRHGRAALEHGFRSVQGAIQDA